MTQRPSPPICFMANDPPWRLPIAEALTEIEAKRIDGDLFLRSVMHHPSWLVSGRQHPDGRKELGVLQTEKGRILEVYSDREALLSMEKVHGDAFTGTILELEGHELFIQLDEGRVDRVNLNPNSEPKISYQHAQIELLAAWARQAQVELALLEPDRVHDPFSAIANYDNYYVVYDTSGRNASIVLAPDAHGRALGAMFTSWDTADAFCKVMQEKSEDTLEAIRMAGSDVFPIMQNLSVQGMVFNPWSLLPARAIHADALTQIIPRIGHTH